MRSPLLVALFSGVIAASASARQGEPRTEPDRDHIDPAALFRSRCASCHAVPDPSLRTDRAWLGQVARTSWTSTPKRARAALADWLVLQVAERPRKLDSPPPPGAPGVPVETNVGAGSILLQGPRGDVVLVWEEGRTDRRRSLPAGPYRLRTTRVERELDDERWFLSSTGPAGDELRVGGDEPVQLDVGDEVRLTCRAEQVDGKLDLGFMIRGEDGRGLSIYRSEVRVPIGYRVLAGDGALLTSGTMNYG